MIPKTLDVNGKPFAIIKLLGKGKGGYSYLADDNGKKYVLKQIHHEPCDYYQFGNKIESEINDYKKLKNIGINIPEILEQMYEMCKILYDSNTNIDYFPTNFIVQISDKSEKIFYIDYECNDYMEEWNFENWGINYWSKTPEFLKHVQNH